MCPLNIAYLSVGLWVLSDLYLDGVFKFRSCVLPTIEEEGFAPVPYSSWHVVLEPFALQSVGFCFLEGQCQYVILQLLCHIRHQNQGLSHTSPLAYGAPLSHVPDVHPFRGDLGRSPWPIMQHLQTSFKPL